MVQIKGQYFKGILTLQKEVTSEKPLNVIVVFPEVDDEKDENLNLSQFGFAQARELLKDFKGSFTETLLEERRQNR